jgi:hypothetical protein
MEGRGKANTDILECVHDLKTPNILLHRAHLYMKASLWLALILHVASTCRAQVTAPTLKSSDLQADAAILRNAYEHLHPGLYRYNSKVEMDASFAALHRQLDHDQTLQDAFLAFSQFASKVRCGHTQANPFNQGQSRD